MYEPGRKILTRQNDCWLAVEGVILILKRGEYALTKRDRPREPGITDLCTQPVVFKFLGKTI